MRKVSILIILLSCILLSACQSQSKEMPILGNIMSLSISESEGFGGINDSYFMSISEEKKIEKFTEVLGDAVGKKQHIDLNTTPDYDIVIHYENDGEHLLHLILGKPGEDSLLMYVGNEKDSFIVSPENTYTLREILGLK